MRNCNTNDVHISFVSVEKGSVIDYIKGDMKDIIGLTFIDEISFIVIFKKKYALFYIKHSEDNNKNVYTSASHVKSIKFDKEINVFMYNKEFKVLGVYNTNNVNHVVFYLISSEKNNKGFDMNISLKQSSIGNNENSTSIFSFLGLFTRKGNNEGNDNNNKKSNDNKKEHSFPMIQLYLETLYNKLYLIVLDINANKLTVFHIINIGFFEKKHEITLPSISNTQKKKSVLQFIDNLIIYQDISSRHSSIYDIKMKRSLLMLFPSSLTPLTIYDTMFTIKRNIIISFEDSKEKYYYITFNNEKYYNNYPFDVNYEALFHLLRRRKAKDIILKLISSYIIEKDKVKILAKLFSVIAEKLYKKISIKSKKKSKPVIHNIPSSTKQSEELIPNLRKHKHHSLNQQDLISMFQLLSTSSLPSSYIITIMVFFYAAIFHSHLLLHYTFHDVLYQYIIKLKNLHSILIYFQFHTIPDSVQVAKYFISSSYFQMGIDMLQRLHKYEDIIIVLLESGKYSEAILYMSKYKKEINIKLIKTKVKTILLQALRSNNKHLRRILLSFILS